MTLAIIYIDHLQVIDEERWQSHTLHVTMIIAYSVDQLIKH